MLTPLEKFQFFDLLNFLLYTLERRFFVQEYHERHLPGLYCLKKKLEKMAILKPKPWVNPFRKMSIFRLFQPLFLFFSLYRRFFVLEYHKTHFSGLYCLKKKLEKSPFLDQDHWLTPLENCQSFDFLNFLFLLPRKEFFRFRIS